jgi:hypothetical protein
MANASQVPDVTETDLERSDLEEAARELGIDEFDDLEDQELFERIGVALGEIDLDELEGAAEQVDEAGDEAEESTEDAVEAADEDDETAVDEEEVDEGEVDEEDDEPEAADEDDDEADEDEDEPEGDDEDDDESEGDDGDDAAEADEDEDEPEGDDEDDEDDEDSGAEPGEYRFEDDPREGIEPLLDLETGPVALDVLGVEIHLRRVHAVLAANPNGKRNILGKLLAQVATAISGSGDEEDDTSDDDTSGEDDTSGDDETSSSDDDSGDDGGMLDTITSPARGLARGAKKLIGKD